MRQVNLGSQGLVVSSQGLGCMGMSGGRPVTFRGLITNGSSPLKTCP
jgi:aryl-alcohol dehydrogenase-like predicted oxidoreductase